jgi:hypothetical protein
MSLTKAQFHQAAAQLRSSEALLTSHIREIQDSQLWRGNDANRFFDEWDRDVRGRLLSAATKLDTIALVPFL